MKRRLKQSAVIVAVILVVAQFVRPDRTNPPTDSRHTIHAQMGTASALTAVLDRACRDCHSNDTVWPRYTSVAPLSWAMAWAVREGRRAVNFSEWAAYPPEQQRALLVLSCDDASAGRMPGAYTVLRPETRLSARDIETICGASRQFQAQAANGR